MCFDYIPRFQLNGNPFLKNDKIFYRIKDYSHLYLFSYVSYSKKYLYINGSKLLDGETYEKYTLKYKLFNMRRGEI